MSIIQSVGRLGDEGPESGLLIQADEQGDIYVTVKKENRLANLMAPGQATVRFCTLQGGGRSLTVRRALLALRDAIQAENERDPHAAWDADAPAGGPAAVVAGEAGCTCQWKAGHDSRCPAYAAYVTAMDAGPEPAVTGGVAAELQALLDAPSYNAARYAARVKAALPGIIAAL